MRPSLHWPQVLIVCPYGSDVWLSVCRADLLTAAEAPQAACCSRLYAVAGCKLNLSPETSPTGSGCSLGLYLTTPITECVRQVDHIDHFLLFYFFFTSNTSSFFSLMFILVVSSLLCSPKSVPIPLSHRGRILCQ